VAKVILIDKKWTHKYIPHFQPVIDGVSDKEGIEISLSCNLGAFEWIIAHLSKNHPKPGEEKARSEEGVEL